MLAVHLRGRPPTYGLTLLTAVGLALFVSACAGPSGHQTATHAPAAPTSGTTPNVVPAATSGPGTPAPPGVMPPGETPPPSLTHSSLPRCRTGQLAAVFAGLNDASGGARGMTLILTNRSSRPCQLYGYPGLGFLDMGGFSLPTHVTRVGVAHTWVKLRPGGNAQAQLTWHAGAASPFALVHPRQVEITPPNAYRHVILTWPDEPVRGGEIATWPVSAGPPGPVLIGTGTVQNPFNGMCIAVAGNSSANGTKVVVWKCDGDSSQRWAGYSDGTLRIHGKCLDVIGGSTNVGAKVDLWACNGSPGQRWVIGQASQNPFGGIMGAGSGNALTDPGDSTVNGSQLEMGADHGDLTGPWHVSFYNYLRE
jgi:Domain of unknown function (DUF4232)/Ricin-type beta-trefoil lectin domain